MTGMPSSFTPRSCRRSRMSCALARSISEKLGVRPSSWGRSHPACIHCCSTSASNWTIAWNSRVSISCLRCLARIGGLSRPPLRNESLQLRIGTFRQHHLQRDEFVAFTAVGTRCSLSLQTKARTGIRPLWYRHHHRAGRRGHAHLAAEHGLLERDRQIHVDIIAFAFKDAMRADLDFDERVAGRAAADPWPSLAAKPQDLSVTCTRRDRDIERGSVRKRDLLFSAINRIKEIQGQTVLDVRAAHAKIGAALATENLRKNLVVAAEIGKSGIA